MAPLFELGSVYDYISIFIFFTAVQDLRSQDKIVKLSSTLTGSSKVRLRGRTAEDCEWDVMQGAAAV